MRIGGCLRAVIAVSIASGQNFPTITRQVQFNHYFGNRPIPRWSHGWLVARDIPPPLVTIMDRTGAVAGSFALNIPGASDVIIDDAAASPAGRIAIAGSAGNLDGKVATFIVWTDIAGKIERIVRTSPFAVHRVWFEDDRTLWALGWQMPEGDPRKAPPPHDILRQYDGEGRLVRTALPNTSFKRRPRTNYVAADLSFLTAAGGKIGVYSDVAQEWVETGADGTVLGRWRGVEKSAYAMLCGIAFTPDGNVYAVVQNEQRRGESLVLTLYRLDKKNDRWVGLNVPQPPGFLLGVDQKELVAFGGESQIAWLSVEGVN